MPHKKATRHNNEWPSYMHVSTTIQMAYFPDKDGSHIDCPNEDWQNNRVDNHVRNNKGLDKSAEPASYFAIEWHQRSQAK